MKFSISQQRDRVITVRLNGAAWVQLKTVALNKSYSVNGLILDAVDEYLARHHGEQLSVSVPATYLMADPQTFLCKVGISRNPRGRLSTHKATPENQLAGFSAKNIQLMRLWDAAEVSEARLIQRASQTLSAVGTKKEWFVAESEKQFRDFLMDLNCEPFIGAQVFAA